MKDETLANALNAGQLPIPHMRNRVKLRLFQLSLQGNPTACKYFLELTADDDDADNLDSLTDEQLRAIMHREDIPDDDDETGIDDDPKEAGSPAGHDLPDQPEAIPPGREDERTDMAPQEPAGTADDSRRRGVVSHNRPW